MTIWRQEQLGCGLVSVKSGPCMHFANFNEKVSKTCNYSQLQK